MTTSAGPPADVLSALRVVGRGTPDSKRRVQCFCPFHTERTGSFYLYPSGGGKCFGECNAWFSPKKMRELLDLPDISKPPGQRAPEITYDYPDAEGATLFQVVKYYDIQGKKRFYQRRPDPARPGSWINDLNTVLPVLYRLPELNGADPEAWVFIPEGEKDADRLAAEGLVTTTSPMGAGKWMARYAAALKRRRVAIIPDNDGPGREHAESILATVHPVAAAVKVIRLPDLPNHGDVSDWLDAGHEVDELLEIVEQAPAAVPMQRNGNGSGNGVATLQELEESTDLLWPGNKWYPYSQRIINKGLLSHGYFLSASGRYYFFDQETKILCELDSFDMAKILSRRYRLNLKESLYIYLVADMKVEAATNGVQATIHQLTYYDAQNNLLYVDMGNGAILKLDGKEISECDNGEDGVLFTPSPVFMPWKYSATPSEGLLQRTLVNPLNFAEGEGTPYTPDQQRILFLMWLMALAFESIQPTKPLALAVGPVGAGKSHVFRRVGQLLLGSRFELDMLRRDKEDDFFVAITNKPFVVFDNVDQRIPWLNDSLASTATGGGVTKKVLYTTNEMAFYVPRAFIALTARTPRFRREDVAERLVIFHLDKLVEKRPEYILLKEIEDQREALLSDWVQMLNRIVAQPMPASQWTTIRLADFAHIALRVAAALGFDDEAAEVLDKLKRAQYIFATEESELYLVLDAWIDKPVQAGLLNETNAGRFVHTKKLLEELRLAATDSGIRCNITSAVQLGRLLKQLREALGVHFDITDQHREGGTSWCFKRI